MKIDSLLIGFGKEKSKSISWSRLWDPSPKRCIITGIHDRWPLLLFLLSAKVSFTIWFSIYLIKIELSASLIITVTTTIGLAMVVQQMVSPPRSRRRLSRRILRRRLPTPYSGWSPFSNWKLIINISTFRIGPEHPIQAKRKTSWQVYFHWHQLSPWLKSKMIKHSNITLSSL